MHFGVYNKNCIVLLMGPKPASSEVTAELRKEEVAWFAYIPIPRLSVSSQHAE